MQENELKKLIRKKIRERLRRDEIDEATTTGNVSGYEIPFAFGKDGEEDEEHIDSIIKSSGYKRVN